MKGTVDLRSLTFGVLLGVCIMIGRGQAPAAEEPSKPQANPANSQRYQISAIVAPNGTTSIFLLDSQRKVVERYINSDGWRKVGPDFDIAKQVEQR